MVLYWLSLGIMAWVDWRLILALFFYNMSVTIEMNIDSGKIKD